MVKTNEKAQLVAAIFVTAVSTFGAWHYSQPALSSVPSLSMPGAIFVAVATDQGGRHHQSVTGKIQSTSSK
ncbi:hypothetical protein [Arthrobacter sp. Bi26]|uniref:hypothetical protein n=1 Tax=Arthrobacter sp. Bi26 TaxID=2822350 RepID=UPI001E2EA4D8|nr:hypothetical protein [Arthrobacter sp. Bi26]